MTRRKQLLWHIFTPYLVIIVASLLAGLWYASTRLENLLLRQTESDLKALASLLQPQVRLHLSPLDPHEVDRACKEFGAASPWRYTVILPSGVVVGDSDEDPSRMDNHLDRPEVSKALTGSSGVSTRSSPTLGKKMMYLAIPLKEEGKTLAVTRVAVPLDAIHETRSTVQAEIALGGALVAVLAAVLGLLAAYRIKSPVEEMNRVAEAFSRGEFQSRLPTSDLRELASLSESMNQMAQELQRRMDTMVAQRNELEAVFSSMVEGVFGVDREERILGMNQAASRILGCDASWAKGRSVQEAVRNPSLQRFIKTALSGGEPLEEDILFYGEDEQVLNTHATPLRAAGQGHPGVLIVLHDVTRLRNLENIRKDFVANASHEIRTPITAIKGFVETLREGAAEDPREAERFLGIIQKHVERLEALVEDLLSLSRIEKEAERKEIPLTAQPVREVLVAALQLCQGKAAGKDIPMELACPEDLKARINSPLLEQAMVNLLDNAITYSEPGRPVRVTAAEGENEILIQVRDEGCGIEKVHLGRLFERFYRVDRARSRKLGGTGLGLSIVKHIMEAHRGRVSVESEPGKGSIFTVHLLKPPAAS
ncbi:MAG: two-component system histidine kinase PnpS [Thermodesulfobacteriota bacterium]